MSDVVLNAGPDANPAVGGPESEQCDEFRPRKAPPGILVMMEKGILTRVSVSRNTAIKTPEGLRVGDTDSAVLKKYGSRARVQPHEYSDPPAKYITVWRAATSDTERRGLRYEIDMNGKVAHIRGGGRSIEYVEGCL